MTNTEKFFWALRNQSLTEELEYKKTLLGLCQKAWSEEQTWQETKAVCKLESEIKSLEEQLAESPL